MYFDDRLATVLRTGIGGDRAMHTQFRQLLDLLGTLPDDAQGPLVDAAFARFASLSQELPAQSRSAMVREPGLRLSSNRLVAALAVQETEVAAAAMAAARLPDPAWQALIPDLPLPARGFLRHRRDLGEAANAVLQRLGIGDLVLPCPNVLELSEAYEPEVPAASPMPADRATFAAIVQPVRSVQSIPSAPPVAPLVLAATNEAEHDELSSENVAISTLVQRIEAFQRARSAHATESRLGDSPRLPLNEPLDQTTNPLLTKFDFATDANGRIDWSETIFAPMVVGLALASEAEDAPAQLAPAGRAALRQRQPLREASVTITGAPAVSGLWQIDAYPRFDKETGRYLGHFGRMQRPPAAKPQTAPDTDHTADRMRQILHELRTPVNAIQGFAEIIQQQLYGPAPHEYRALAATIASDAARILAGFDELDRLARLESGALELDEGNCDIADVLVTLVDQIRPALLPRSSEVVLSGIGRPVIVPLARAEAERLCWRLLASLAGEASAGEEIALTVTLDGNRTAITLDLPANLAGSGDIFSASLHGNQRAISAGMFGSGFTLRLARAEARAAGGDLARDGDTICLVLPLVTEQRGLPGQPPAAPETTTGTKPS